MQFPDFCGPAYTSQSVIADCQSLINLYVEIIESGKGRNPDKLALYPTPGLSLFVDLTSVGTSIRGLVTAPGGRSFCVVGDKFYELNSARTGTSRGTVTNDGLPSSMAASETHILIASGGNVYTFVLATNTFAAVNMVNFAGSVSQVEYVDGYFIALISGTGKYQISSLLDPTTWDITDIKQVQVFPGRVVSIIGDHRELCLLGTQKSCVDVNTGAALFPFELLPGSLIEQGCAAEFSVAKLDNSVFWLGGDERGQGIVWRMQGYTPTRVSTHAIENAIQGYAQISDAIAYAYQDKGHSFYVLHFPTPSKTWVYDASTGMWAERAYRSPTTGALTAHKSRCHTFNGAFGMHLVGDYATGKIFEMSTSFSDDAGDPIRRVRRAPHVTSDNDFVYHGALEILIEAGLGPLPPLTDGAGAARGPQMMFRMSNDGSKTWGNERTADMGQAGEYKKRVRFDRLGAARDRVYEVSYTDAVRVAIVGALLELAA